jgi:tetratricopeptide (TPR) repeat protein
MNKRRFTAVWLLVVVGLLAGCAKERECACPQGKLLDRELMLLLSTVRAYHHQADIHLQQGNVDQAIATVRKILQLDLSSKWPEAEEVRLDATARLAKLLLGQGKEDEALETAREGLSAAQRESFYLSNLHSVLGEILEQRSKRLDKDGQKEEARQVAREAIAAFEQSITINKRLQQQLLKERGQ